MAENEEQNPEYYRDVDRELKEMVEKLAENLPMRIDNCTRLDSAGIFPERKIFLQYTLLSLDPNVDLYALSAEMKKKRINLMKTSPDMDIQAYKFHGITLVAAYCDEQGNELFRITVNPDDIQIDLNQIQPVGSIQLRYVALRLHCVIHLYDMRKK